jgi:hypothetical protein
MDLEDPLKYETHTIEDKLNSKKFIIYLSVHGFDSRLCVLFAVEPDISVS